MPVTPNPVLAASPFPGILHATLAGSEQGLKQLSIWQQILEPGAATPSPPPPPHPLMPFMPKDDVPAGK